MENGPWAEVAQETRDEALAVVQAKRQRLGQGNHRGTGEGVEWTPQTVGMESIGLEDG